jgi:hypothetical protein
MAFESANCAILRYPHRFSCILEADVRPLGRTDTMHGWDANIPQAASRKIFRRPARHGSAPRRRTGLRMNVNGRLTAPPLEAALVTNSVCATLPEGARPRPEASGHTLDISSFFNSSGLRTTRAVGLARVCEWMQRKFDPVSATQLLFVDGGAASGA